MEEQAHHLEGSELVKVQIVKIQHSKTKHLARTEGLTTERKKAFLKHNQ
jgi:hypothetical protein